MKRATFRVLRFNLPGRPNRYVAMAWNYAEAVLLSTRDHDSYTDARAELDKTCADAGVELRWYDGLYDAHPDETITPATG